jgi:hypothetical protein
MVTDSIPALTGDAQALAGGTPIDDKNQTREYTPRRVEKTL